MRRTLLTLALLLLPAAAPLAAQAAPCPVLPDSAQVDRVVAVVGDSVILFTELQQECEVARAQGLDTPPRQLLENLIDLQALLQAAARDTTMLPSDAEVARRVEDQIERARAQFPDDASFQQALAQQGLTLTSYREQLRNQIRRLMIRETYQMRLIQGAPPAIVSEAEMRAFFDEHRAELQERPEILTVQQVLIRSGASDESWERAYAVADSLYRLVLRGADFATLAREHSRDPGSAAQGGELGWVPRGMTVPGFERAAFALRDGGVSAPVRTEYGYHVILAERSRPGEKRLRHILIEPESSPADIERARALGEDVARRIRAGERAIPLAQQYGDAEYPREFPYFRGEEGQSLPEAFVRRLATAAEGEVIGPFDVNLRDRDYVAVLYVSELRGAGEFTFEDVRDQIRQLLTQQKRQERIYRELRERTYVEVRF